MKVHKPQHIYNEIFRQNYYVSFGLSSKELQKSVHKYIGKNWDCDIEKDNCGKFMIYETKKTSIFWIWTKERDITVLAHELMHCVFYTLKNRPLPLTNDSQELYSYMLEWLFKRILKPKERYK